KTTPTCRYDRRGSGTTWPARRALQCHASRRRRGLRGWGAAPGRSGSPRWCHSGRSSDPRGCTARSVAADSLRHLSGMTANTAWAMPVTLAASSSHLTSCSASGPPCCSRVISSAAATARPMGSHRLTALGVPGLDSSAVTAGTMTPVASTTRAVPTLASSPNIISSFIIYPSPGCHIGHSDFQCLDSCTKLAGTVRWRALAPCLVPGFNLGQPPVNVAQQLAQRTVLRQQLVVLFLQCAHFHLQARYFSL